MDVCVPLLSDDTVQNIPNLDADWMQQDVVARTTYHNQTLVTKGYGLHALRPTVTTNPFSCTSTACMYS